jgi:IS4 transposase
MVFSDLLERFVESSPACVMHRALLEHVFAPAKLDAVFQRAAEVQYQRELLFSTVVELTSQVVCRISKSVHAVYVRQRERISVSLRALYDKLNHMETGTSRALVQHTAAAVGELIDRTKGRRKPLLAGYRTRILDGNHLGKTEHRLGVLRRTSAGALPGQALVLLDPQRMLIEDVIPCEDGHAQERSLLDQLLPVIERRDLVIDDRNFCTLGFLFGLLDRKASFITRQHGRMPYELAGKRRYAGRCETGRLYEQVAQLTDSKIARTTQVRRITVVLKSPTRDGDQELHLLTNLPASKASAVKVAQLYRQRWTLEQAFNELTTHLRCELNTLGYPKAALFAFCTAVASYNFLAAVKGALRGVHGLQTVDQDVSNFFLTDEINTTYAGMMIALPPEQWAVFQTMSLAKFAAQLRRWAATVDLGRYPKYPRGPKKPQPKRPNAKFQHVSTAKLLAEKQLKLKSTKSKKRQGKPP